MDLERLEKLSSEGDEEASRLLEIARLRKGELEITVEYDGEYPNACSGTLTIRVGDREIYSRSGRCSSSGEVWFDEDWNENVETGELTWTEADKFPKWVQEKVRERLEYVDVCCGGCV